jgi:hypothetical protein
MQLSILLRDEPLDDETRRLLRQRAEYALSRFATAVQRITITTSPAARPMSPSAPAHSGDGRIVELVAHLKSGSTVSIFERNGTLLECVARGAERLARSVGHRIRREVEEEQGRSRMGVSGRLR